MEERYHRHSTIITMNLGYDEWQNFLGNKSWWRRCSAGFGITAHGDHHGPSLREPQG